MHAEVGFRRLLRYPLLWLVLVIETVLIKKAAECLKVHITSDYTDINCIIAFIIIVFFTLVLFGKPWETADCTAGLQRAGLCNHAGEVPLLIQTERERKNRKIIVYTFYSLGVPYEVWLAKKAEIEASLDITITQMLEYHGKSQMRLWAVKARDTLPETIHWKDKYLDTNDFKLKLGIGPADDETVDLAMIPHILIGGSTGSGKSQLLKLLLHQCDLKGAQLIIADFKGGVDFPASQWGRDTHIICYTPQVFESELSYTINVLNERKTLFLQNNAENITKYNEKSDTSLPRMIIACDEIAELFDTTGKSPEEKEIIKRITGAVSTIARQGRAFGIHLVLATQRPDANVLPGQIKNNIDCRICGKADDVLSRIILDNSDAANIPKCSRGRFLDNSGITFQAYYYDNENCGKEVEHRAKRRNRKTLHDRIGS